MMTLSTVFEHIDLTKRLSAPLLTGLSLLGAYFLARNFIMPPVNGIWRHFIRPRRNIKQRYPGEWVLVTGASDGISEALCYEFAKMGYNIILLARTPEKLKKVANNVMVNYGRPFVIIQYDFENLKTE